jgi:hypothetical protein
VSDNGSLSNPAGNSPLTKSARRLLTPPSNLQHTSFDGDFHKESMVKNGDSFGAVPRRRSSAILSDRSMVNPATRWRFNALNDYSNLTSSLRYQLASNCACTKSLHEPLRQSRYRQPDNPYGKLPIPTIMDTSRCEVHNAVQLRHRFVIRPLTAIPPL